MPPMALGRAHVRASALPKAPWRHFSLLGDRNTARRECDRGGGSGTERGRVRCVFRAAVLGMARHAAGSLLQRDSSPPPARTARQCPRVSRRPSVRAHFPYRPPRKGTPHPAAIRPARAPHSQFEPCPLFLGNQECPHHSPSLTHRLSSRRRSRASSAPRPAG